MKRFFVILVALALLSVMFSVPGIMKYTHLVTMAVVKSPELTTGQQRWCERSFRFNFSADNDTQQQQLQQQLPVDTRVRYRLEPNEQQLLPSGSCSCKGRSILRLASFYQASEFEAVWQRRRKEMQEFLMREDPVMNRVMVVEPNSPLSYPTHGLQVPPMQTILILGLSLHANEADLYKVTLSAKLGVLNTVAEVDEVTVEGLGEWRLSLSSRHLENLNLQLRTLTYTNTFYQPGTSEMMQLESGRHIAQIPIVIAHPNLPWLYDPGPDGKISSLVTVVTKTFLRYEKLKGLIASIRSFYPNIIIIVADDSEKVEMLNEPGVEQYIMPFGKGWFAGRNLAISQVVTKYLLWVDDDFLFSKNTRLERMVEVLEKASLDVVGGVVGTLAFPHILKVMHGGPEGECLLRKAGSYHELDGFPTCSLVDMVVNFFLARTDSIRRVSFDPQFSRIGHTEFFVDSLGKLKVGTCKDISIDHAPKKGNAAKYNKYRHAREARGVTARALFFKNHLKCYSS